MWFIVIFYSWRQNAVLPEIIFGEWISMKPRLSRCSRKNRQTPAVILNIAWLVVVRRSRIRLSSRVSWFTLAILCKVQCTSIDWIQCFTQTRKLIHHKAEGNSLVRGFAKCILLKKTEDKCFVISFNVLSGNKFHVFHSPAMLITSIINNTIYQKRSSKYCS